MTDQNKQSEHLSDLEIAKVVDLMIEGKAIPSVLQDRLEASNQSRHEVAELYRIAKEGKQSAKGRRVVMRPRSNLYWVAALLMVGLMASLIWFFGPSADNLAQNQDLDPVEEPNQPKDKIVRTFGDDAPVFPTESVEEVLATQTLKEEPAPVYALLFEENEELEPLVGNQIRSSGTADFKPALDYTVVLKQQIDFSWADKGNGPYTLIILNNRGEEKARFSTTTSSLRYLNNLPQGLFYWKLENEDDLLYVGRFKVMPQ